MRCLSCGAKESSAGSAMLVCPKKEKEGYKSLQLPIVSHVLLVLHSGAESEWHLQVLFWPLRWCSKTPGHFSSMHVLVLFMGKNLEIFPPNFGPTA